MKNDNINEKQKSTENSVDEQVGFVNSTDGDSEKNYNKNEIGDVKGNYSDGVKDDST